MHPCGHQARKKIDKYTSLEAVEARVDVAGHEFDPSLQHTLLRAASYGQVFCRPKIGIPLCIQQYKEVVIMHWACSKLTVSSAIPDPTLLEILLILVCSLQPLVVCAE
nr:protein vacuoleless1 [Tanacetum cinerariifolium]